MIDPGSFGVSDSVASVDPRVKVIAALLLSVAVALLDRPAPLALAALLALGTLFWGRLSPRLLLRRLALVNGFNLMLWLLLPPFASGEALFSLGPVGFSREGFFLAAAISLKSNVILLFLMVLLVPIPVSTLGEALCRLRLPEKLVLLLLLSYRYLFLFEAELRRLLRGARVRGFVPGTDLHSYRTFAHLIGMLLVRALERAHRVQAAMELRGFTGRFHPLHDFRILPRDRLFLLFCLAACSALGVLQWI